MAIIHRKPEGLNLSGNLKDFELTSNEPISFKLYRGYNLLLDLVYPESTKSSVKIDIQKIVESHLSYTFNTSERIYEQTSIYADFIAEIDGVKHTFRVIRCGISNYSAPAHDFLGRCFLTWQPVEKKVTYYSPEWLTYYALESCSINITVTFEDKSQSTKVIVNCLAKKAYTIDMQYGVVVGLFGGKPIAYYEVYVKLNDVIISEVQRYIYSEELSISESWIVWENSLGGLDTARVYGSSKKISEHTHNTAIVGKQDITYDIDTLRSVEKNTGYLNTYERKWMKDFFPATKKYIYSDASILPIIVTKDNVSFIADDTLSSYSFSYQFAKQNKYLNINKQHISMPQQISLPVPDRPGYLESPKLVEFPRINISDGVMLAVQQPHTDSYSSTTIGAVKEYLLDALQQPESKHKGFFNTSSGLISAYPNPTVGDNAWIGSVYPGVVYDCVTRGVWRATATVPPAGNVTLADYPKKSEMLIVSETNPTTPPTLNGQFHYNKTENRMFVAASGNASPLTQIEGRSLLGTAPASWKIRYNQDSGLVSSFEQIEGGPLMRASAEQIVDSNELEIEVEYYGEIPEEREGYDRALFYGVEPNETGITTLEIKNPTLYATYAVTGWVEVASKDYVDGVVFRSIELNLSTAINSVPGHLRKKGLTLQYIDASGRLNKSIRIGKDSENWYDNLLWVPEVIQYNGEVINSINLSSNQSGSGYTKYDSRNEARNSIPPQYKKKGFAISYILSNETLCYELINSQVDLDKDPSYSDLLMSRDFKLFENKSMLSGNTARYRIIDNLYEVYLNQSRFNLLDGEMVSLKSIAVGEYVSHHHNIFLITAIYKDGEEVLGKRKTFAYSIKDFTTIEKVEVVELRLKTGGVNYGFIALDAISLLGYDSYSALGAECIFSKIVFDENSLVYLRDAVQKQYNPFSNNRLYSQIEGYVAITNENAKYVQYCYANKMFIEPLVSGFFETSGDLSLIRLFNREISEDEKLILEQMVATDSLSSSYYNNSQIWSTNSSFNASLLKPKNKEYTVTFTLVSVDNTIFPGSEGFMAYYFTDGVIGGDRMNIIPYASFDSSDLGVEKVITVIPPFRAKTADLHMYDSSTAWKGSGFVVDIKIEESGVIEEYNYRNIQDKIWTSFDKKTYINIESLYKKNILKALLLFRI